ncbi:DUF1365 domain-containing protein [Wenxinia marina]|uniref:Cyclopropane-fatty-acyl-phospholipid synthase n=1 Tax=Wenxinia marina DSM 24838 TaxID=1123501 RepID=A0A0D0QK31_9RHOB|nr:DUF1365 domain-containing protein [Wenxinia marina]KIQ71368.1 hypothetical protein Wenmar_00146 [Wenxinia marina DSM 24838]GGL81283.1 DUF1365 domain-containing protein [Wenxinia marina]
MSGVDHIAGETFHGRRGEVRNAFRYSIDYVLLDAEADVAGPLLFSRNRRNVAALRDRDHGGPPADGQGAGWVRRRLAEAGRASPARIELLAQPRLLGHVFNPVSFWLCRDGDGQLTEVIAEVTNTYGDRHSYLCVPEEGGPIGPASIIRAHKLLHVSPFQPVAGDYAFRFDIRPDAIDIRIDYRDAGGGGLVATLTGARRPLTSLSILRACLRRPFGSRRVLALIHWQALKLWWKGAPFRNRPEPPAEELSR